MTEDILFQRRGAAGIVVLNRPKALNAVSLEMIRLFSAQLAQWQRDDAVTRVIVTAAGDKAFSAGGDLRHLYDLGRAGRQKEALEFFRAEYSLNAQVKHFTKPYISLIDGIVMGGGVGISIHGSHRVAGDKYQFAMPEVGIGFFPDVGGTYALTRMPGEIGTFCALTGDRLKAADAVGSGAATHRVRSARFAALTEALCGNGPVDETLGAFAEAVEEGPVLAFRAAINRLFSGQRVKDILDQIEAEGRSDMDDAAWARSVAALIRTKAPLSLKIALEQMRRGKDSSFDECMRMEFRIVSRVLYGHDLYEGIRAVIIDKDNAPKWNPDDLASVSDAEVLRHFEPLGADELDLS